MFSGPLWAARQRAQGKDWTLVEGMTAGATPAGITTRDAYETLREGDEGKLTITFNPGASPTWKLNLTNR